MEFLAVGRLVLTWVGMREDCLDGNRWLLCIMDSALSKPDVVSIPSMLGIEFILFTLGWTTGLCCAMFLKPAFVCYV